jgi:sugar phosphate isomerase/epimerase
MRLTASSYSFEAIPLEGTLAIVKSMGFKAVDIAGFHNRGRASYEPDEVGADPQKHADHLNALLDKYELEAMDFFPQFGASPGERSINDPDPNVREKDIQSFKGIVKFCKLTGMHTVTVLPGVDHLGRSQQENLDLSGQMLKLFAEIAGEQGIRLCFEPHMGSVSPTPELAISLVERAPDAKITLDYSHFLLQYIPIERIEKLIPYTGHFHIRQARPGKLQTRLVEGTLDFVDIARKLKAAGYDGAMSVEYVCSEWYDLNRIDTLAETMATKELLEAHVPL